MGRQEPGFGDERSFTQDIQSAYVELWGEQEGFALVSDYDRVRRWRRMFLLDRTNPHQLPRLQFNRDMRDRYEDPGTPLMRMLPTVVWTYPREHQDPATAGQVAGSTQRFTTLRGASPLFYLLHGYAVLDNATIPVMGDFHTVNDT